MLLEHCYINNDLSYFIPTDSVGPRKANLLDNIQRLFSPPFSDYGLYLSCGHVKGDELYLTSGGGKSGIFSSDLRQAAYRDTQYLEQIIQ